MPINDKTSNFLKAIDKYAKEQQKEIKLKANEFKIKELQKAEAEVLAKTITAEKIIIPAKTGQNTKLFGAVTSHEIADALNKKFNLSIDKKNIHIKEPIKSLGTYTVEVRLYTGVVASVDVEVVPNDAN